MSRHSSYQRDSKKHGKKKVVKKTHSKSPKHYKPKQTSYTKGKKPAKKSVPPPQVNFSITKKIPGKPDEKFCSSDIKKKTSRKKPVTSKSVSKKKHQQVSKRMKYSEDSSDYSDSDDEDMGGSYFPHINKLKKDSGRDYDWDEAYEKKKPASKKAKRLAQVEPVGDKGSARKNSPYRFPWQKKRKLVECGHTEEEARACIEETDEE
jgi:hypothetical protein